MLAVLFIPPHKPLPEHKEPLLLLLRLFPIHFFTPLCLSIIPQAKGRVSAILQGGRLMFSALCSQIAGYFYAEIFQNIGIIIAIFILMTVVFLFFVMKNCELMKFLRQ